MLNKIKAGIIGGAGYTGGEMLRILVNHPHAEIAFVHSNSNGGNLVSDVHTDLLGDTILNFSGNEILSQLKDKGLIDVLFLCVGHGDAKRFLEKNPVNNSAKIIDLSQDYRLQDPKKVEGESPENGVSQISPARAGLKSLYWTYGLPELNRDSIKISRNIANPGCFATCIQLGLLPLAAKSLLQSDVHINATTGSTGAGQSLSATSHFSWRNNNLSVYKAFQHQHLKEIYQSLNQLQPGFAPALSDRAGVGQLIFIPQRGDFTRGILAAMYTETRLGLDEAYELYESYYKEHPFTHISRKSIHLKQVVNTNKCLISLEKHDGKLFIVSIIDNLLKGASGQAVQNMNLMFGLDEMAGLRLKGVGF